MVGRFFSRFRQPKAQFEVEVVDKAFFPGSTVEIRAIFRPEEHLQIREAMISLTCIETYWTFPAVRESSYASGEVMHTTELTKVTDALLDPMDLIPGTEYRKDFEFTIPEDAPPTVKGDVADISWQLVAYVEPEKGAQIKREQRILVSHLPITDSEGQESTPITVEDLFDTCAIRMDVDSPLVETGRNVTGKFS